MRAIQENDSATRQTLDVATATLMRALDGGWEKTNLAATENLEWDFSFFPRLPLSESGRS
jgi:hypothetical protein